MMHPSSAQTVSDAEVLSHCRFSSTMWEVPMLMRKRRGETWREEEEGKTKKKKKGRRG